MARIRGKNGDDFLDGKDKGDWIYGFGGNDVLSGHGGNDRLFGGDGNDVLVGGSGNDLLRGGLGSDQYQHSGTSADGDDVVETGDDSMDSIVFTTPDLFDFDFERDGNDLTVGILNEDTGEFDGTLRIVNHYAGASITFIQADLAFNDEYGTDPNLSTIYFTPGLANGINNTDSSEILIGTIGSDVINGNGGYFDYLTGGGGDDTIHGGDGFDNVRGGDGSDQLFGDAGDDLVRGDRGDDDLDGGEGTDLVRYDGNVVTSGVLVDLSAGIAKDLDGDDENVGTDSLANFENVRGSNFADEIYGSWGDNLLQGGSGNDLIDGREGNDYLQGAAGDDTLIGGDGDDSFVGGLGADAIDGGGGFDGFEAFDATEGIWISLADGLAYNDGFGFIDTVTGIEAVYGSAHADNIQGDATGNWFLGFDGDDLLLGGDGDDGFEGGTGFDYIDGGSGHNRISFGDSVSEGVYVQLHAGVVLNDGTGWSDVVGNIQEVAGTVFDDLIEGDWQDNFLYGGDGGHDTLAGLGGNDHLLGVDGDDLLIGGDGYDLLDGGSGADTFRLAGDGASDEVADYVFGDGDVIDLSDLLDGGLVNPSNFGEFVLVGAGGSGVDLRVDADGALNGQNYVLTATLDGVQLSGQIAFNIDNTTYTYDNGAIA
jgi:Ca2+-binding RTX toxin-like protein